MKSGAPVLSMHTDQHRWIKVTAFIRAGSSDDQNVESVIGYVDVPLIDNDGVPYADPMFPPTCVLRRCATGDLDAVAGTTTALWTDSFCNMRYGSIAGFHDDVYAYVSWQLSRSPTPHWVLRFHLAGVNVGSPFQDAYTLMADVLCSGYGKHNDTDIEVGTLNVPGHTRRLLVWDQQDFLAPFNKDAVIQRCFAWGRWASTGGINTSYLNSPDGASTDTALFKTTVIPALRVYRGNVSSSPSEGVLTDWDFGTAGCMWPINGLNVDPFSQTIWNAAGYSTLQLVSGKWEVKLYNKSGTLLSWDFKLWAWGIDVDAA
jgi:hypothetical protein